MAGLTVIGITISGKTAYYRFTRQRINIPHYGVMTPDEVVANKNALKSILEKNLPVIKEATKEEYEAYQKEQADLLLAKQKEEASTLDASGKKELNKALAEKEALEQKLAAIKKELSEAEKEIAALKKEVLSAENEAKKLREKQDAKAPGTTKSKSK